jgi:cyclopropane-fatty-acyl-phospholipid synthase
VSRTRTDALRRAILGELPDRPVTIAFWDGTSVPSTRPGPTLSVRSPAALVDLMRAPGQLGLVRPYVRGDLEVDDLDAIVELASGWGAPQLGRRARVRLLAAAARAVGFRRPPAPPSVELRPRGRLHGRLRDARAVRHHYELPPEFFALFLDESLTYSCALFSRGAQTLEEAQQAKLELVCRKLELRPGARVLDIGCGWGSFALHAARHHGARVVGITLSESQARTARERAAAAGLADRAEFQVLDYRELRDQQFDAVCSIGMVEHVGLDNLPVYAERIAAVLRPGGRALNHGIAWNRPSRYSVGAFNQRYVFPDGDLPHLSDALAALGGAGLEPLHVEGLREDYAETMRHWIERFDAHLDDVVALVGEERTRVWRLYLRASRAGFTSGNCSVFQILASRDRTLPARPQPALPEAAAADLGEPAAPEGRGFHPPNGSGDDPITSLSSARRAARAGCRSLTRGSEPDLLSGYRTGSGAE